MQARWTPFVLSPEDDWSGEVDSNRRKRTQDRLAQRARRAKLRATRPVAATEAGSAEMIQAESLHDDHNISHIESNASERVQDFMISMQDNYNTGSLDLEVSNGVYLEPSAKLAQVNNETPTEQFGNTQLYIPSPKTNFNFIILTPVVTIAAYQQNANLLQVSCEPIPRIFDGSDVAIPPSLTPTQLQQTIPHLSFVDIIPFPGVRNRLIHSLHVIDQGDISVDLVENGFRVWGTASWDGTGWEVSEAFARKWWFLIDDELLRVTNFWRRQRSDKPLLIDGDGGVSI